MAVTLKRKRGAVSYREPSSDDDFSESDDERISRKRARPVRRSARHQSADAEPSSRAQRRHVSPPMANVPVERPKHSPKVAALRRRRKHRISYRDVSTDDDDDSDEDFETDEVEEPPRKAYAKPAQSPPSQKHQNKRRRRLRPIGGPLKPQANSQQAPKPVQIPTDGYKPLWATLPYHVLLQIFVYASHPLHDENMVPTSSIPWLVRVAKMCAAFTKPALTALHRNPPVFAMKQNRKELVHHLISPPEGAHEDYRVMVKRLELDATQMPALTDPTHSVADLAALITSLTTLKEIDIFDPLDRPPYRGRLKRIRRWYYPDELFTALRQSELRLQSWRWNSTFCSRGALWMKEIHADRAFQSLRELTLTKYHTDPPRKPDEDKGQPIAEELLGSALAVLPNLRSLAFETCSVVNGRLLPLLPTTLRSLNITNCIELTSEHLQGFLATHGGLLEDLVLLHNQYLDLSFLVDLKSSCPRLEVLRMDLKNYSSLTMSADNEPLYDYLLGENEIPTWPASLRVIDMEYLRKWSSEAATHFFSSLINSAEELPWLRELRILAMVDVDWRQRADFRRKWTARFEKVFARRWIPPSPHLVSMRAYREWKASWSDVAEKNDSLLDIPEAANTGQASESDSDVPLLPSRKRKDDEHWTSSRLRSRVQTSTNYEETSDDEDESGSQESPNAEDEPEFIQGRCHTVIFRLDNFRPREELYDEDDFLDEERSGDEDWNGNDVVDDEYAW
ncbi:hypothetical protein BU26DRAFT_517335 [Trematosphaeria pertusa]|uniref:Uncharacterized protein n=1 Tax=Trematosphaeria pertusa TaxID=390896 RepID=A0A6A6ILS8_9PLEO|nr:uncharacterized protein BU26DRAFT_517335 [Trematosphaeria pertusa]KAF2250500.1 hypothetical protein BU26DRAFT_517335 [Trematosphaeria pertusa]